MSRSRSPRGSASPCWAATAPVNRPSSASSRVSVIPTKAPCGSVTGTPPAVRRRSWRGASARCSSTPTSSSSRTLREDVSFGPRALGLPPREVRRRTDEALGALDLHPHAAQHPDDLSPALRKLAALAGALALEPALLVLDEPTAGLDRAWRARVADAGRDHAERGAALLVGTHDLAFAPETLERGVLLD